MSLKLASLQRPHGTAITLTLRKFKSFVIVISFCSSHDSFIYVGGLPFDLTEGDVVTIFSQYGEPTYINLVRDKETGKSKGFAFLKYEDQRSTDLAVDNMGGAEVLGRVLRVDHTRYKVKEGEVITDNTMGDAPAPPTEDEEESEEEERPLLKEEIELQKLMRDYDDEDPMKAYLIEEKKAEVEKALIKLKKKSKREREKKDRRRRGKDDDRDRRRIRNGDEDRDRDRRRGKSRSRSAERSHKRRDRTKSRSPERQKRRERHRSRSEDRRKARDRSRSRSTDARRRRYRSRSRSTEKRGERSRGDDDRSRRKH